MEDAPREIFIASDHRGFDAKNHLVAELNGNYSVSDLGPFEKNPDDDYNDAALAVARAVKDTPGSLGILLCGSGNGICIQANRQKGIRAIAPTEPDIVRLGREHNNANVLCLSADFLDYNKIDNLANIFLNTDFSGEERHVRRNQRLDEEKN